MERLLAVLNVFARIALIFGIALLLPIGVSWWTGDGALPHFDEAFLGTLVFGGALLAATHRFRRELRANDGVLLVVMCWALLPLIAALPLLLAIPGARFVDVYFEAVSGLTATGATAFSGLDRLPASINLWRTELHWIGGLGIIVLAVAILPLLGVGGRQLMKAEVPGPVKEAGITPRVTETAKGFWKIYLALTLLCTLAYGLFGMTWLDALTHAFSTVALGGFSSHDASFAFFDSPALEGITIVFALLSGMSYVTHFAALSGRSLRPYLRDGEAPFYLGVLGASVLMIAAYVWHHGHYAEFAAALRHAAFNTVSVATTLGYASTDYSKWPLFAPLWMLFLCSFATCSASTGGGIKMMRAIILYKQVFREGAHAIHPSATTFVKLGGVVVPNKIILSVLGFSFLYMACTIVFTLLLSASGADIVTAFSATVACFNNTGPGLGLVGPDGNYGVLNDFQVLICSFAMLLGRLEIFTLLVVLTPAFWRK
ncbi:MAG: Trk system potassium uptake protein TrkH [Rhodocyclaceae bacterium]|nr:MAG: TrkH family potassium uptake protein [Rhodocyclaceae bacterium]MBV6406688.1 Trk system potassium uptake protein TrkH [Rhodocyclaceae bacterium]